MGGPRRNAAGAAPALDPERVEATLLRHAGAGPRYTSYPTAPVWSDAYDASHFASDLGGAGGPLSVYVHVPFCRSLCHFCACNRMVTRNEELPERFLDAIAREVEAVREAVGRSLPAAQHHWGGGTPTHLRPEQIHRLFRTVNEAFPTSPDAEISIEADPRVTGEAQLEALRACGFQRLSLGVQDFDDRVQRAIHREQSVTQTGQLTEQARALGFRGVSFDLIYGLPFQTVESMERTLDEVIALAPDRIALYGYAHVTWIAKQQRGFERGDLPGPRERLQIFVAAIRRLVAAGYLHVGLDHFARPEDALVAALRDGTLRRNFMGYTTQAGLELIGFGPSGISELGGAYAQNERELAAWQDALSTRGLATLRGHRLSADDQERRFVIQSLLCLGTLAASAYRARFGTDFARRFADELAALAPYEAEGLLELGRDGSITVGALGRLVLRNIAMVFDAYLPRQREGDRPVFSQTI